MINEASGHGAFITFVNSVFCKSQQNFTGPVVEVEQDVADNLKWYLIKNTKKMSYKCAPCLQL